MLNFCRGEFLHGCQKCLHKNARLIFVRGTFCLWGASVAREKLNMEENTFKRQLGIIGGISLAAGSTIGSGIFTNPTLVLGYTGSVGASLLIWAACGINAILCGFSYLEVALLIRQSGGTYGTAL